MPVGEPDAPLSAVVASVLVDAAWRIVGWSPAAMGLFGLCAREVLGHRCNEVLSCRDLHGNPICSELCPVRRSLAWSETAPPSETGEFIACDGNGRALGLTAIVGLRPEEAAGHVLILLRRTGLDGGEFGGKAERATGDVLGQALDDVLDEAMGVTGAEVAEIFLREPPDRAVLLAGFRGPFTQAFHQITRFRLGEGVPGLVTEQGRALLAVDVIRDERFLRTAVKEAGFRHYLCVPVPGREGAAGSLSIASRSDPQTVLPQWLTLRRVAERLGLILEMEGQQRAPSSVGSRVDVEREVGEELLLRCLGHFSVWRDGVLLPLDRFSRRRALTVMKILLTHYGRVVSRENLLELLWPEGPPKDAGTLLKVAVHYLRKGLEPTARRGLAAPFIVTEGDGYGFNLAAPHRLDVRVFETAAQTGLRLERGGRRKEALAAFEAAAAAYTGDYLEDEPYSEWCRQRRGQLRQMHLAVLRQGARLLWVGAEAEAAIRWYRRALGLDPCLEDVHRELMEVLWRSGRRTEALRQYETCRQALREEIDVPPLPETEALYRSIHG